MKSFLVTLVCLLLYIVCFAQAKFFTSHACEGHTMKLFCYPGKVIIVKSADYGRSNDKICQVFEDRNAKLNCHTKKAKEIVSARCTGEMECMIEADNRLFGDPCPGQVKYVEATYDCVSNKKAEFNSESKPCVPKRLRNFILKLKTENEVENRLSSDENRGFDEILCDK